jgi:hypothetical protein
VPNTEVAPNAEGGEREWVGMESQNRLAWRARMVGMGGRCEEWEQVGVESGWAGVGSENSGCGKRERAGVENGVESRRGERRRAWRGRGGERRRVGVEGVRKLK